MNALAVLVLLLFFIVLALSLTVWAALTMGTRRRQALAADRAGAGHAGAGARAGSGSGEAVGATAGTTGRAVAGATPQPGVHERGRVTPRRAADLPWLRPQPDAAEAAPRADRSGTGARRPRVVDTDEGGDREQGQRAAGHAGPDAPAPTPARATVTPRKAEPDAFDRFLDAERRRD